MRSLRHREAKQLVEDHRAENGEIDLAQGTRIPETVLLTLSCLSLRSLLTREIQPIFGGRFGDDLVQGGWRVLSGSTWFANELQSILEHLHQTYMDTPIH